MTEEQNAWLITFTWTDNISTVCPHCWALDGVPCQYDCDELARKDETPQPRLISVCPKDTP